MLLSKFAGKNVALWKRTTQTSTYSEHGVFYTSDKAVDGNTDGNFAENTCTHTNYRSGNTWNVELGGAFTLIAIKIYNRNDNREYTKLIHYCLNSLYVHIYILHH